MSFLSKLRGTDAEDQDVLERQWNVAAQEAADIIQIKEEQLQLVTDYCKQIQTARDTLEKQKVELDTVKM